MVVTIGPTQPTEVALIFEIRRDPNVLRYQYAVQHWETEDGYSEAMQKQPIRGACFRSTSIYCDSHLVGHISRTHTVADDWVTPLCYCSWNLTPTSWGQGIMPAALTQLFDKLRHESPSLRIVSATNISNHRSVRVLEKVGMMRTSFARMPPDINVESAVAGDVLYYELPRRNAECR